MAGAGKPKAERSPASPVRSREERQGLQTAREFALRRIMEAKGTYVREPMAVPRSRKRKR